MTEELVKHAVNRFWLRRSGWGDFVGIILVVAGVSVFLWSGDREGYVTVFMTIAIAFVVLVPVVYLVYRYRAISRNRRARDRNVVFRFDDEGIFAESCLGYTHLKWPALTRIWRFPRIWLLFFSRDGYIVVPTSVLETEASDFILEKVKAHGGKIK